MSSPRCMLIEALPKSKAPRRRTVTYEKEETTGRERWEVWSGVRGLWGGLCCDFRKSERMVFFWWKKWFLYVFIYLID